MVGFTDDCRSGRGYESLRTAHNPGESRARGRWTRDLIHYISSTTSHPLHLIHCAHQTVLSQVGNNFFKLIPISAFEWFKIRIPWDEASTEFVRCEFIVLHKASTFGVSCDVFAYVLKVGTLFVFEDVIISLILQFKADSTQ